MDLDNDLFADEPAPKVNLARGRFQPKAKPRPGKETTAPVDVTVGDNKVVDPVGVSLPTLVVVGSIEQLNENAGAEHALHSEVVASDGFGDLQSSFKKANADVFTGLECFNGFPSQPTDQTETSAFVDSDYKDGGEIAVEGKSSENISASIVCDAAEAQTCPDLFMIQDPVPCKEATVPNNAGGGPFDYGRLETEVLQERAFPDLNCLDFTSEAAVASGWRAGKYKPKPKVRTENEKNSASLPHLDGIESVMHLPNAQFSSETECMPEGSVPVFSPDDVFDYSSIDLGDIIPPDPATSEFPMNEELANFTETNTDAASSEGIQQEDVPAMNGNQIAKGKASNLSNLSRRSHKSSLAGRETEGGKASRQLRKGAAVLKLVDEPDAHKTCSISAEPTSSTIDEDEGDADRVTGDSNSQRERAPRKSKKPATETEKPVRKRKKANEASDKSNKNPPKKFSHSTRRKRTVSKELLETPEDEIDHQKVPMKDLILLAEYKERLASKEAKVSKTPLTNQSAENPTHEEGYHNEEETFTSEQDNGPTGDQSTPRVQYFNYQSFMKKTPTVRWSKQETELFYEAIRQFGTDLSMIQQLFPGRTRQQVKLKYKKEERKHPLRLTEALTNRAKDHSHFEKVIEQLQQVAAQAARDAQADDSVDLTGDEVEELNPELNDEVGKVEQDQDGQANVGEVHSPLKADEIDDDDDIWSSYKSEF